MKMKEETRDKIQESRQDHQCELNELAKNTVVPNIKRILRDRNMTQKQFANAIGATPQVVNNWLTKCKCPDALYLTKISKALNTSIDYLCGSEAKFNAQDIKSFDDLLHSIYRQYKYCQKNDIEFTIFNEPRKQKSESKNTKYIESLEEAYTDYECFIDMLDSSSNNWKEIYIGDSYLQSFLQVLKRFDNLLFSQSITTEELETLIYSRMNELIEARKNKEENED